MRYAREIGVLHLEPYLYGILTSRWLPHSNFSPSEPFAFLSRPPTPVFLAGFTILVLHSHSRSIPQRCRDFSLALGERLMGI